MILPSHPRLSPNAGARDHERNTSTRNPATGAPWQPGEYEAALAAVRAEALTSRGTGDLPSEPSRAFNGTTQNWLRDRS